MDIVLCEACGRKGRFGEESMATFDVLIDDLASRFGLGANSRVLVREVLAMIAGTPPPHPGSTRKGRNHGRARRHR